jgi:hypothetical protein
VGAIRYHSRMTGLRLTFALAALALLAACANRDDGLRRTGPVGDGPDDFSVLPSLPLTIPETLDLPQPTPGGANRTDRDPVAEGLLALGGSPGAGSGGHGALVAAASANGVDPGIRATLASEDAAFRARASALRFGQNAYWRAYGAQALDAYAELARLAATGVALPSAPPER